MSEPKQSSPHTSINLVETFKGSAAVQHGFFNITLPVKSSTIVKDSSTGRNETVPVLNYAELSDADAVETEILFGKDRVTLLDAELTKGEDGHYIPFDLAMNRLPVKGNFRHHSGIMKDGIHDGIYIHDEYLDVIKSVLIVGEKIYFLPLATEEVIAKVNNRDNEIKADVTRWLASNDVNIN